MFEYVNLLVITLLTVSRQECTKMNNSKKHTKVKIQKNIYYNVKEIYCSVPRNK